MKRQTKRTLSILTAAMLLICCIVSPAYSFAEQRLARSLPAMRGSAAELELMGKISTYGAEILGMFIPYECETPEPEYDAGDVDMNGTVEVRDALLAARFALGLQSLSDEQAALADVDNDGSVGIDDAVLICRIALGVA